MEKSISLLTKVNKAFQLVIDGRDSDAAKEFEDALQIAKERTVIRDICNQLGQCYIAVKELEKAEDILWKAIANCTEDDTSQLQDIFLLLLSIYTERSDRQGLTKTCEEIVKNKDLEKGIRIDAATRLANIYFDDKKYTEGMELVNEIIEAYGDTKDLLCVKVKLSHQLRNYKLSLSDGLDYVQRFGFDIDVYTAIGVAYGYFKSAGTAFKYFRDAYESLPEHRKMIISTDSKAFSLTDTILSGSIYHEECSKEYLIDILKRRYDITSKLEVNKEFDRDYGFFKRLRIGYLSADLKMHPVGEFVSPVILNRNTCHSDNICYSVTKHEHLGNPYSDYLKESSAEWHDLYGKTDNEIEEFVLNDKADILLELASLTEDSLLRLYAKRLAPLQVSWIGFPVSTGIKAIDYVITDKYADPPGMAEEYYTEKLLYLPDTFLCHLSTYANKLKGIPYDRNGYITFGCFNNAGKITDRMLKCWKDILNQVDGSRLLLKTGFYSNTRILEMIKERINNIGIDLDRVDFEVASDFVAYLDKYNDVDIILDTYPFNGATTTIDSFMMGVPIVALIGERHVSRVSLGMLINVGLGDLAVFTDDDYVKTAVRLARDVDRLRELKRTLRDIKMKSKLADVDKFREEYEHAMRQIWIDYCIKTRKYPVYGGLSLKELSDSLVNGAFYIRKLIEDSGEAVSDTALLDEYISLQRVFFRKLEKAWKGDAEKTKPLETIRMISNFIYKLKTLDAHDMDDMLLSNTRFIKHFSIGKEFD